MQTANPILVEVFRGNAIENIHRGAFVVAKANGEIVKSAGDADRKIFPRSAIKAMQALAIFRSGADKKFDFTSAQLAMACASHHGEPEHEKEVTSLLAKLGLSVDDLECGAHPPSNRQARNALSNTSVKPSAIHNNCSGKHAGMLAVALALGVDAKNYVEPDHAVQKLVRTCVEDVCKTQISLDHCGTDGCSIPTWAAPLSAFATGFARMATGEGLEPDGQFAAKRVFDAATTHPKLIAGTGATDTDIMSAYDGDLMLKIGAEGVYCGAIRSQGLGFALKCDDGNMAAAEAMVCALLAAQTKASPAQLAELTKRTHKTISNWNKREVAHLSANMSAFA